MTSLITPFPQDPKERLLILFPEDLLFLSVDEERTTVTYEVTGNSRDGQTGTELRSGEQLWVMKINSKEEKKKKNTQKSSVFLFFFWRENSPWLESRQRRNPLCWGGYSLKSQVRPRKERAAGKGSLQTPEGTSLPGGWGSRGCSEKLSSTLEVLTICQDMVLGVPTELRDPEVPPAPPHWGSDKKHTSLVLKLAPRMAYFGEVSFPQLRGVAQVCRSPFQ